MQDIYHLFMAGSWAKLLGLCLVSYLVLNGVFATLYLLEPGSIVNAKPGSYGDAFWFSVQTYATIGFGVMSPATTYAHILVTLESFFGLFSLAIGTGLVFAKFSKPTARLGFSDVIIVTRHNTRPCLSFRDAHQRRGSLIDVHAKMSVLVDATTAEGATVRRAHELNLERSTMPMLALAWTVIHVLDSSSPLSGLDSNNANEAIVAIIVHITGVDETTFETLHARHVYNVDSLRFNVRFVDMIDRSQPDRLVINHSALSQTTKLSNFST
jgi:inward rectifier potassium channel